MSFKHAVGNRPQRPEKPWGAPEIPTGSAPRLWIPDAVAAGSDPCSCDQGFPEKIGRRPLRLYVGVSRKVLKTDSHAVPRAEFCGACTCMVGRRHVTFIGEMPHQHSRAPEQRDGRSSEIPLWPTLGPSASESASSASAGGEVNKDSLRNERRGGRGEPLRRDDDAGDRLVRASEIAGLLGVVPETIASYRRKGMPYLRLPGGHYRYPLEKLRKWLRERGTRL